MKQIKVLVIGQGFMGGIAHPRGILEANQQLRPQGIEFVMDCVAGRNEEKLAVTQKAYGYNRVSTNWEKEIGKADLVVVTSPNKDHAPMAVAALKAGKAVVCEKPLSSSLEQAQEMAAAAKKAGVPTMVTFCYQGAPGALEARRLIQEGLVLGKKISELTAQTRVYDGDGEDLQMIRGSDKKAKGKAVDAFEAIAYFDNGCSITFRSNRTSTGHKAFFENTIHGNRGGVQWELEDQAFLKFYSHTRPDGMKVSSRERGWTHIHLSDPGGEGHYNTDTVPGLINGYLQYFRWQYLHLGLALLGKPDKAYSVPSFADACQVEAVTDAIYRSGSKDGELTKVPKI